MSREPRKLLAALGRGSAGDGSPLFAPLVFGVASQIEALPASQVAADPTRLCKGLTETRRALGTSALYTTVPAAAEAEALGVSIDDLSWPPRITASPGASMLETDAGAAIAASSRLQASLEATRRLAATEGQQVALIAALTGPATLLRQLHPDAADDEVEDGLEFLGGFLVALVRAFGEAGAHAVLLLESAAVPEVDEADEIWADALAPVTNVARFHKMPLLLGFAGAPEPAVGDWPGQVIPCPSIAAAGEFTGTPHGVSVEPEPARWPALPDGGDGVRVVVTAGEVPVDTQIATLRDRVRRL